MKSFDDFLKDHPNVKPVQTKKQEPTKPTKNEKSYEDLEEFDKIKSKVLKYVLYKKRTEQEVRQKFSNYNNENKIDENLLDEVIQNLKENGYISDTTYIERAVNEFIAIKTLSIKEMYNKLYAKGIKANIIDTYFENNKERLEKYEIECSKKIILKKSSQMEKDQIENFLYKKGYTKESIKTAFEELA